MTITQLTYFIAVAESGSLTQVAKQMNVSQPAVSGAIRELESEFNVQLFRRAHRKLTLTNEGEEFFREAAGLVTHFRSFQNKMQERISNVQRCRFGISPNVATVYLADIYSALKASAPDLELDVKEGIRVDLVRMVRNGILDIICTPANGGSDLFEGLKHKKAVEIPYYFFAHKDLFYSEKNELSVNEIKDIPIAMTTRNNLHNDWVHQLFLHYGLAPKILCEVNQMSTIQMLTQKGMAGCMFPAAYFQQCDHVKGYRLMGASASIMYLVWKNKTPAVERFLRGVQDVF